MYFWYRRAIGERIYVEKIFDVAQDVTYSFRLRARTDELTAAKSKFATLASEGSFGRPQEYGYSYPPDYKGVFLHVYGLVGSPFYQIKRFEKGKVISKTPALFMKDTVILDRQVARFHRDLFLFEQKEAKKLQLEAGIKSQRTSYYAGKQEKQEKIERQLYAATKRPELVHELEGYMCHKTETGKEFCCSSSSSDRGYWLPVIRYPSLYHSAVEASKSKVPYCGTFYFFEPHSPYYLFLGRKFGIFGSKLHALWYLLREAGKTSGQAEKLYQQFADLDKQYRGDLFGADGLFRDVAALLDHNWKVNWARYTTDNDQVPSADKNFILTQFYNRILQKDSDPIPSVFHRPKQRVSILYPSEPSENWIDWKIGIHDYLDQPICYYARALGYDTVLFQREKGGGR